MEINPLCNITAFDEIFCLENADHFNIKEADYIIDAIDSFNHKLDLIETAIKENVILFSSMGMALKKDPLLIKAASIWKTDVCPLARRVRSGLKKRGFTGDFTAVYSSEHPAENASVTDAALNKTVNGSIITVTGTAGFLLASLVINHVISLTVE